MSSDSVSRNGPVKRDINPKGAVLVRFGQCNNVSRLWSAKKLRAFVYKWEEKGRKKEEKVLQMCCSLDSLRRLNILKLPLNEEERGEEGKGVRAKMRVREGQEGDGRDRERVKSRPCTLIFQTA